MVKLVQLGAIAALAAALAAAPVPVLAKETRDDLKQEIEALKQGQQEILKQLEEIKKLVQARPSAPSGPNVKDVSFTLGNNPVRGSATDKLTIVEFTDYQ